MSAVYFPGCKYTIHSRVNSRKIRPIPDPPARHPSNRLLQHRTRHTAGRGHSRLYLSDLQRLHSGIHARKPLPLHLGNTGKRRCLPMAGLQWRYRYRTGLLRSFDNRPMQDAVRHILGLMNVETVEIAKNFEKTDFCGSSLMKTQSPRYSRFAPVRFFDNAKDKFIPLPPEEQERRMQEHGKQFTTEKVVCYCTGCLHGLKLGGVNAVHLMDLISARL